MRVVIAGGHGKIALLLAEQLAERGDSPVALVRNPDHADDVRAAGAEPVTVDLETSSAEELAKELAGADAVVFAAGAGPNSGAERKRSVDRDAALLLADAAARAGVRRYVQVSAMGAANPPSEADDDSVWGVYLRAKGEAEQGVRERDDLDVTILRPGRLTDEPATGRVHLAEEPVGHEEVTRADVATTVIALLDAPATIGRTLELVNGTVPLGTAVDELGGATGPSVHGG
ncbi:SDR family oxidoreductase [Actinomycetospora termitidis]|uniref:SDR family oxidoreductase n=1 Tax=Actinomycetospora termitidis TaxID=3053470 RepID=A0ABT7M2W0_9PSEU|nr:SDR family oxidoreductase [Actinomycetospora sp. Odt1-22]MDL5154766.1 SDR family oxidoreductase [Actinomycetospora sp. Odt1-22]